MSEEIQKQKLEGNVLFLYTYDVGDDVDLNAVRNRGLVPVKSVALSPFFKNYHIPLSFHMPAEPGSKEDSDCISSKIYSFGALSFCYRVPFEATFDELQDKLLELDEEYEEKSEADAKRVYQRILRAVKKPTFYLLKNSYMIVQVDPSTIKMPPREFKSLFGEKIARILRFETKKLSEYQTHDILEATTGYYGEDFVVIDSQAAFIYDEEYFEAIEFFELANVQKLELQYFDRVLYEKLNKFYSQGAYKVPKRAYFPIFGRLLDAPISQLARLRVDISVITERLENSIDMAGEAYYSNLYAMLVERLQLEEWKESINKKLSIVRDIYTIYQDHLDAIHEEILTFVIIILIAIEAIGTFWK